MASPVVIQATSRHTATVIFLHGLGDTGHGWAQMLGGMRLPHVKYVCPTAPTQPVTLNGGMRMPSWFDIRGLGPGSPEDVEGIQKASDMLQSYISEEEKQGIQRDRIVVGGFSQGGAIALFSAFTNASAKPLAGILALSTFLPQYKTFPAAAKHNLATPVLQCHGESDPLIDPTFGAMSGQLIKSFNTKHQYKSYPGLGHSSCDQEMEDVEQFIKDCLPPV